MPFAELAQLLGNLGEFVGAIGVVATLVYLAMQVRHSREALDANTRSLDESRKLALAQTYQARSDNLHDSFLFVAGSREFAGIQARMPRIGASPEEHRTAYESLEGVEKVRYRNYLQAHLIRTDNLVFQREQGLMTDEYYGSIEGALAGFGNAWEALDLLDRSANRPSFLAEIERARQEVRSRKPEPTL